ncbi:MAG: nitroreductase [Thaumarchaeota archaeon]|nr:nitroreductase [Candidatus Geocrenenecus arthurdayi]MCL7390772.1 nitroreductase [Candidatus Geocrenenecus arthurdayi]
MDVIEAIKTRRSIERFKPEPPPRELIEKILEAGTWAPNHHLTEPWGFFVLTGRARERLGEVMAQALAEELPDPDSQESRAKIDAEKQRPLRAPVIIAVAASPKQDPNIVELEEVVATSAAIQNMLLAAHALGLGAKLRTGKAAYRKKVKEFFGLSDREYLLGFIYLGYPDVKPQKGFRTPFQEKTVWLEY